MRTLFLFALLATTASAQTAPEAGRCDAGDAMPTPFPAEPGAAETTAELSGPEPVPMPNLCGAPVVVALRDGTAPSNVRTWKRPLPTGDIDQLRQRYDLFRERTAPDMLLRLDPLAPSSDRFLRDVEPFELRDRWIPYPDLHAPDRLILRPDLFPQGTQALPPVAPPAGRE
ncbi:hypothetical protein [Rubrivirga sp. IMCC43871]|uniref:hypothetical protein n=1 Tax=Rubrivirga sp. IMCC43871 TaxID=3391575 RepID=UPI00399012C3